jgi:hypothetical protein
MSYQFLNLGRTIGEPIIDRQLMSTIDVPWPCGVSFRPLALPLCHGRQMAGSWQQGDHLVLRGGQELLPS